MQDWRFVSASPLYTGINLKNEFFEFHRPHAPRLLMRRYLFWQLLHRRFLAFRIYLRVGSCLPCMGDLKRAANIFDKKICLWCVYPIWYIFAF